MGLRSILIPATMLSSEAAINVLILDNYDSFTFNLAQYVGELGSTPLVYRNDALTVEEARELDIERIIISPGPGTPKDAGVSADLIRAFEETVPVLGVCLGHQVIMEMFGGRIAAAPEVRHGKTSPITHDGRGIFSGLSHPFQATRYHSLAGYETPEVLEECAWSEDGVIQGVRHKSFPITGVQFHPESILTTEGKQLLKNFLKQR
jgi:anthranilate synthase/aminodeoxychorismate synthase-like glutamine amidotransferase